MAKKTNEANPHDQTSNFDPVPAALGQSFDQQADPDHFAAAEGMGQPEKGHCRHAPGDKIVGGGDIKTDRPPG